MGGEESLGRTGWYECLWHWGWSGDMWITGEGPVYFWVSLKCQSERHCFSCAQNKWPAVCSQTLCLFSVSLRPFTLKART